MTQNEAGWSALHDAALLGDAAAVDALLAEGADANAATSEMMSSLTQSQVLRPKGATIYPSILPKITARAGVAFDKGTTPLHVAASVGALPILEALQRAGAKVTALDGVGASALHHAALGGHVAVVAWLLKTKIKVDAATRVAKSIVFYDKGVTALHAGLESGSLAVIEALLGAGASLTATTAFGCTSLFFAARGSAVRALDLLQQAGVAVDGAGTYSNHPLVEAVERGHHAFVAKLLSLGFKTEEPPNAQQSALRLATKRGDARMRQLLLDAGATPLKFRALSDAAALNDIDAVRAMLAAGVDVNSVSSNSTALMTASMEGNAEVVEMLLAAGARLDAKIGRAHV